MLGAIIGDIVGSVYEFNNIKTPNFPFYSPESNYTDDSIMTIAVADYLLSAPNDHVTLESKLVSYANQYKCPKGGYGGKFRKWLFQPELLNADGSHDRRPYGSFGNGSAMRVSAVGWLANSLLQAEELSRETAQITHNHPEGIKGAQATAVAILMARQGMSKEQIRCLIEQRYGYNLHRTLDEIRPTYSFNETCQGTVPEAIIAFLESTDFESAIRLAVSLGGDCDTLTCITGAIAEAYYKEIPDWIRQGAYALLPDHFKQIIERLYTVSREREVALRSHATPSREKLSDYWRLETFYRKLAEEEGATSRESRLLEIPLLDYVVAGTTFCKEFDKTDGDFIHNGMTLRMMKEDNKHDANAIALYVDQIKIGYIPKRQNEVLARLLEAGKLLVSRVLDAHYNDGWEKINARVWMIETK